MVLLFLVVAIVVVGATVLAYRNRPANSIESGISSFRREMRALAPPLQRRRPPATGDGGAPAAPDERPTESGAGPDAAPPGEG